ncbi:hypothetical protein [Nitrososphaera sp. AFS]|uniref:hypothetical protein n=1 Tax=Nitrososphaera sp. AFS TaxID=2301191 RepID=UPI0013922F8C|nr:hypothetical protein [Nitrososphaera sp. AFS]
MFPKITLGQDHNGVGRKHRSRCELYVLPDPTVCIRCGRVLKQPITGKDKQRLRRIRQKREEQDRIIKVIKKGHTNAKIE